jgi:hypothetical protein
MNPAGLVSAGFVLSRKKDRRLWKCLFSEPLLFCVKLEGIPRKTANFSKRAPSVHIRLIACTKAIVKNLLLRRSQ